MRACVRTCVCRSRILPQCRARLRVPLCAVRACVCASQPAAARRPASSGGGDRPSIRLIAASPATPDDPPLSSLHHRSYTTSRRQPRCHRCHHHHLLFAARRRSRRDCILPSCRPARPAVLLAPPCRLVLSARRIRPKRPARMLLQRRTPSDVSFASAFLAVSPQPSCPCLRYCHAAR